MDYLKKNHLSIGVLVLVLIMSYIDGSIKLGAVDRTTFTNPITFASAVTHSADSTFSGGDGAIVVTTSNTATSSIEVGCIQMTATSTANPVRLVMGSSILGTTTYQGSVSQGAVVWQYGTCP